MIDPLVSRLSRRLAQTGSESGIALLMAIITLGVISVVGVVVVQFSSSADRTAEYASSESEARALADAGLNEAMSIINAPSSDLTDPNLLQATTTAHSTGEATWSGTLDTTKWVWTLTSAGSTANPIGGTTGDPEHTVSGKVWISDTVYTTNRDMGDGTTDREIWLMNVDGTGAHPITDNDYDDGDAFWSPDIGRFVFETERDFDAVSNAGQHYGPAPSRDPFDTTNRDIYAMNVDGSGVTRLTDNPGTPGRGGSSADEDPQWGPNELIAFDTLRNGYNWTTGGPSGFKNNWDVYLMETDGSNQQNLTGCDLTPSPNYWTYPGSGPGGNVCSNDQEPAFGAIGASNIMCLQSNAQTGTTSLHGIPFTINTDGSLNLGAPYVLVSSSGRDRECDWSADGTKLTYMSDRDGDWEIFVKDITTGVETQVTNNTVSDQHPGWTPDDRIVWNSPRTSGAVNIDNADGNEEIFIMDDDGTDVYQVSFTTDGSYNSFADVRTRFDLYDYSG